MSTQNTSLKIVETIVLIIAAVFAVVGIYYLLTPTEDMYYYYVTGKVIRSRCITQKQTGAFGKEYSTYACSMSITYNVNNRPYFKSFILENSSIKYEKDDPIMLMVDKNNPRNLYVTQISRSTVGGGLLSIALLFLVVPYLVRTLSS